MLRVARRRPPGRDALGHSNHCSGSFRGAQVRREGVNGGPGVARNARISFLVLVIVRQFHRLRQRWRAVGLPPAIFASARVYAFMVPGTISL